ncbi:hypothetical protein QA648_16905 [Rhizobium sp. CB3171]|uniref:hypothetical protein n=1 Tax=Rhizobium sp. CB3171 TaxID=3039157 RepID=UPI0024B19D7E|nr:hypothetical protein [Rhizobium sp. CB3171]WFU01777.1 hypothetical protein QA648_16905 [Rhizobium sp. CB3171]
MSILGIGYYDYVVGLVAAMVAALLTKQKVLQGRFGKFAVFEHLILPAIFIVVGATICSLVEIDETIVTGTIVMLAIFMLVILVAFAPFLFIPCAFFAYAFVTSWEKVAHIAVVLFVGVTIGNFIGFGLGSRSRAATQ